MYKAAIDVFGFKSYYSTTNSVFDLWSGIAGIYAGRVLVKCIGLLTMRTVYAACRYLRDIAIGGNIYNCARKEKE
jgi:hypothetical protein